LNDRIHTEMILPGRAGSVRPGSHSAHVLKRARGQIGGLSRAINCLEDRSKP
jgi:hypothetical protein